MCSSLSHTHFGACVYETGDYTYIGKIVKAQVFNEFCTHLCQKIGPKYERYEMKIAKDVILQDMI